MVIDHSDSMKSKTKQLRDYVSSRVFKDDKRNTATGNATSGGGGVSIEVCTNNGVARTGLSSTTSTKAVVSGLSSRGGGVGGGSGGVRRLRGESECSSNASSAQLIKVIK